MADAQADPKVLRILDANFNRLREGLRVIEEYFRFIRDDATLSSALKDLRHSISQSIETHDLFGALCRSRDVSEDVLATEYSASEATRNSSQDVLKANMQRVKESLRVLEEYGKVVSSNLGKTMQSIRFEFYHLEQNIVRSEL